MSQKTPPQSSEASPPPSTKNFGEIMPYFFDQKPASEITLGLRDGTKIACKLWGNERAEVRILAMHGWLDNANTWDTLAPLIVGSRALKVRFVAIDFPGHGQSSHKPASGHYLTADYALAVLGAADALQWSDFHLFAHSMGATVAPLVAAAVPNRVLSMTLFDGIAPWTYPLESQLESLSMAMSEHTKILNRQRRVYPSLDAAIQRRRKQNPNMLPKSSDILAMRSIEEVLVTGEGDKSEKGYMFTHDPRLVGRSLTQYSNEFVEYLLSKIACPTLLVIADREVRPPFVDWFVDRINKIPKGKQVWIKGDHHVHLDHPERVFKPVMDFLLEACPQNPKSKL